MLHRLMEEGGGCLHAGKTTFTGLRSVSDKFTVTCFRPSHFRGCDEKGGRQLCDGIDNVNLGYEKRGGDKEILQHKKACAWVSSETRSTFETSAGLRFSEIRQDVRLRYPIP